MKFEFSSLYLSVDHFKGKLVSFCCPFASLKKKQCELSSCLISKEDQLGKHFKSDVKQNSYPKSTVVKLSRTEWCTRNTRSFTSL